jgi:hypothetical protein
MNPQDGRQNREEALDGGERFSLSPSAGERENRLLLSG